jgi:hypothetical protein
MSLRRRTGTCPSSVGPTEAAATAAEGIVAEAASGCTPAHLTLAGLFVVDASNPSPLTVFEVLSRKRKNFQYYDAAEHQWSPREKG